MAENSQERVLINPFLKFQLYRAISQELLHKKIVGDTTNVPSQQLSNVYLAISQS